MRLSVVGLVALFSIFFADVATLQYSGALQQSAYAYGPFDLQSRDALTRTRGARSLKAENPAHVQALVEHLGKEKNGFVMRSLVKAATRIKARETLEPVWRVMNASEYALKRNLPGVKSSRKSREKRKYVAVLEECKKYMDSAAPVILSTIGDNRRDGQFLKVTLEIAQSKQTSWKKDAIPAVGRLVQLRVKEDKIEAYPMLLEMGDQFKSQPDLQVAIVAGIKSLGTLPSGVPGWLRTRKTLRRLPGGDFISIADVTTKPFSLSGKVLQIVSSKTFILSTTGKSYWVDGFSTKGIADDETVRMSLVLAGTHAYTTVLGAKRTIRRAIPAAAVEAPPLSFADYKVSLKRR